MRQIGASHAAAESADDGGDAVLPEGQLDVLTAWKPP
jgi:hypothetical protein